MPPDIAQLSLWQVELAPASLRDGEIAWTVTQPIYRERFSPMAVVEICCLTGCRASSFPAARGTRVAKSSPRYKRLNRTFACLPFRGVRPGASS
jgi:hypothetical protein